MLRVYWRPGTTNLADYFTIQHSAAHHINLRPEFLTDSNLVNKLRLSLQKNRTVFILAKGCVDYR